MNQKEIASKYLQVLRTGTYDPQSAQVVDFMDQHRSGIRVNNSESATQAVVLPAHNEARLLPRCLASISQMLQQMGLSANVIVVNNASTDATGEIATYFGATVIDEPKKGIGQARQSGLLATNPTNKLILTTDSDSVVPPNWIDAHRRNLEDPLVSFSAGAIRLIIDQEIPLKQKLGFYLYLVARRAVRSTKTLLSSRYQPANGANSAFRRSQAVAIGGYRVNLAAMEDYFLMLDLNEEFKGKTSRVNAVVYTSSRRILESGIRNYASMRVQDNIGILTNKPGEPESYEDFRTV